MHEVNNSRIGLSSLDTLMSAAFEFAPQRHHHRGRSWQRPPVECSNRLFYGYAFMATLVMNSWGNLSKTCCLIVSAKVTGHAFKICRREPGTTHGEGAKSSCITQFPWKLAMLMPETYPSLRFRLSETCWN